MDPKRFPSGSQQQVRVRQKVKDSFNVLGHFVSFIYLYIFILCCTACTYSHTTSNFMIMTM